MRLHTSLGIAEVSWALSRAKRKGRIAADVQFTRLDPHTSRTHERAFEVQLGVPKCLPYRPLPAGTVNQYGKPQKTRRTTNGYANAYAATWGEWGWFIAEVFDVNPAARWGTNPARSANPWGYAGLVDFDEKTDYQFVLEDDEPYPPVPESAPLTPGVGIAREPMTEPVTNQNTDQHPDFCYSVPRDLPADPVDIDPCGNAPIGVLK
jgi:hypothetical protein